MLKFKRPMLLVSLMIVFLAAPVSIATASTGNNALSFDGKDDYVGIPDSPALNPSTITVSAWMFQNDWSSFTKASAAVSKTQYGGYELYFNYNSQQKCSFWVCKPSGEYLIPAAPINALSPGWHLFTGTYDGQYAKLYIDGVEKDTQGDGVFRIIHYGYSNSLIIGAEAGLSSTATGDYFQGAIDEVQVFNRALTAGEVSTMYNGGDGNFGYPTDGLVGGWHFDENSGSTVADYSGNDNTGTIYGAVFIPGLAPHDFVAPEYMLGGLLATFACFAALLAYKKRPQPKLTLN